MALAWISARRSSRRRWVTARATLAVALLGLVGVVVVSGPVGADGPTTFTNSAPITIATDTPPPPTPATPYPSTIAVSGMAGPVSDVDVQLTGFSHGAANDVDLLLVGPGGQNLVLLSDPGGPNTLVGANNATVSFDDAAATGVPQSGTITGTVSYRPTDTDAGETVADAFPAPAPSPGAATTLATFTGTNPNGTWSLFVIDDATGDSGSIAGGWSVTITTSVVAAATTTVVTSSQNPSITGTPVTFTATVTSGGAPVTGTVTFTEGPTTLAANVPVNASGQAAFSTSALAEGSHIITATYNGTPTLLTSSGTVTQVVDNATTTPDDDTWCNTGSIAVPSSGPATPYPSHITVSGAGSAISLVTVDLADVAQTAPFDLEVLLVGPAGQNLVLMSDVGGNTAVSGVDLTFADTAAGPIPPGGPLASGTFDPSDDDTDGADAQLPPPAPVVSGATTLATFNGTNPNGTWSLFVHDDASGDSGSIAGGWCLNVSTPEPTTTAVSSSVNPSTVGQSVTFTATVTSGGNPVTTGTVDFIDGATDLALDVRLNGSGQATFTTSTLAEGTHPITASYDGTPAFQPSSGLVTQVVQKAATSTVVTSSVNPSTVGESVTFTATVTTAGSPVTTGTVDFLVDAVPAVSGVVLDGSGQATFTTSSLPAGTHAVQANYTGTAALAASTGAVSQQVDVAATSTAVASSANPSLVGAPVTFTATVTSGGNPVTTGTVAFTEGATTLEPNVALDGSGQATFTTSSLTAGSHPITATYSGTAALGASDDTVTQVVQKAATDTTLGSSLNPSVVGQPVTFTATVTSDGNPVTTGTVAFTEGATTLEPNAALDGSGQATFTTSSLTAGSHPITATYNGTDALETSSDGVTQVVDADVVADAGGPYTIAEGADLALDGSGSTAGAGATLSWDVNGDNIFDDALGPTPTLTWAQLAALGITDGTGVASTLSLRVTNATATATDTAPASLTVTNVAPTATLGNDGPVAEGSTATVTFSGQSDPSADDAATLTYSYDFDDDGTFEVDSSTSPSATVPASFLADGPSTLAVRAVIADDDEGSLALTTDIDVTNAPATVTFDGPSTATVGVPVTLKVGAADPSSSDMAGTFAYTVDWGDGTPVVNLTGPSDPPVTHTYTAAGSFTVAATATDPDGATSAPTTFTMTVNAQAATTTTTTSTPAPAATSTTRLGATNRRGATSLSSTGGDLDATLLTGLALTLGGAAVALASRRRSRPSRRRQTH
jgi:subtilisin-like proprotein convertase family protein